MGIAPECAKRERIIVPLTAEELQRLFAELGPRERTLVLLAVPTGMRRGEVLATQWCDIDFGTKTLCKTESSQKSVPIHPPLSKTLEQWRELCRYNKPDDWIFASKCRRGRKPYWGQAILRRYIRPAALKQGIYRRIGWHTFRHTYSTLLHSVGTECKVMQELMRHSSLRSTLDIYTQAITPAKHAAQAAVLSLVFSPETNGTQSSGSGEAAV
jgi:integrase